MKAKCTVCGEEYELKDGTPAAKFVQENPDKARCLKCFKANLNEKGIEKPKATNSSKSAQTSGKQQITAEVLRKSYDEVKAAFADVIDEVHDFIGGWTTTIALSKNK